MAVSEHALSSEILRLWDFGDPATSERRFAEAADTETDPVRRQVFRTQLARAQGLQGRYTDANATLDAVAKETTAGDGPPGGREPGARVLLERGRVRNSSGDPSGAGPLFRQAYERAVAAGLDGLAVDAAHMLAIVLPAEEHEQWARTGLRLAERSADPLARSLIGALLNNLGWTHANRDDWTSALGLFERALAARRAEGDPSKIHVARWTRARAWRALGQYEDAIAELRALAATPEGATDPYVAEEIAENERARG